LTDEFRGEFTQALGFSFGEAPLDYDRPTFAVAQFTQALSKCPPGVVQVRSDGDRGER
jgi:hypothetical protein